MTNETDATLARLVPRFIAAVYTRQQQNVQQPQGRECSGLAFARYPMTSAENLLGQQRDSRPLPNIASILISAMETNNQLTSVALRMVH